MLNWDLIKNPFNWIIIILMLVIVFFGVHQAHSLIVAKSANGAGSN